MFTAGIKNSGYLFFILAWLSTDHYRPWVNFHSELLAFAGLCCMLASVLMRFRHTLDMPRTSAWIAGFVLLPWVQYGIGIALFAGDALLSSLYLSGLLAAIVVGYSFSQADTKFGDQNFMSLMHCLGFVALASAAIGLVQWLGLQDALGALVVQTDIGDRAKGNLGQPNQLATLLLMGMTAFLYSYEKGLISRFTVFLSIAFLSLVLILTQSRAGLVSVVLISAFLIWKKRTVPLRLSSSAVACWAIGFLIGTLSLPYVSNALFLGNVRSVTSTDALGERWQIWQQVAYALTQSPWLGFGWNQTPTAHAVGAVAFPGSITYTNAHSVVLDLMVWNGVPLGILLSGAIAYWFVTRIWTSFRLEAVIAMACLLPFAVHSLLEFPFAYSYFLIVAGIMVGVVEAARIPAKKIALNIRWAWGFLALWVTVGSYLTYEYFLIEEDFRIVRFEGLRVGQTPEAYEIPHVWMLSHMAAMLTAARQVAEPNMSAANLENLRMVSQRFPYGAIHFRYAQALALNGDSKGASYQMSVIRGMFGPDYYVACKSELRRLQNEKYPQFADVVIP